MLARVPLIAVGAIAFFSFVLLIAATQIISPVSPDSNTATVSSSVSTTATSSISKPEDRLLPGGDASQNTVDNSKTSQTTLDTSIRPVSPLPKSAPSVKPSSTEKTPSPAAPAKAPSAPNQATRVLNPYPIPPLSADLVNTETRATIVNIFCGSEGSMRPTSASGVIIDPKGIILTNAHVAQYVLLSEDPRIDLTCTIRMGSPAYPRYIAEVLFIPAPWVNEHAADILSEHALGTGEYDYALLRIVATTNGSPLPSSFSFLPPDSRETIGFTGDQVIVASYPAEFIGGVTTQRDLYAVSSVTNIGKLLTYTESSVDAFSLGGVIGAQSGSSGGAVVNAWGRLIGVITTMSNAATTAERDLRATTLAYIDRNIHAQTGLSLHDFLASDLAARAETFNTTIGPGFVEQLLTHIPHRQ